MRKLLKTVVAFFLLAGLAVVIFILGHGCVDLSVLKGAAARTIAGQILRPTEIGGTFELHFTPAPVLECSDLRIYDPGSGRKNPLLQLGRIRLGVRVVPLLVGRVEVVELRVADLGLHLRRFADGRKNWLAMDGREDAALQENGNRNTSPDRLAPSGGGSLSIDSITLENIDVWYLEDRPGAAGNNEEIKAGGEHRLLHVAAIHGQLPPDKPLALRGDGVLLGSSFSFRTHLASAAEFAGKMLHG